MFKQKITPLLIAIIFVIMFCSCNSLGGTQKQINDSIEMYKKHIDSNMRIIEKNIHVIDSNIESDTFKTATLYRSHVVKINGDTVYLEFIPDTIKYKP